MSEQTRGIWSEEENNVLIELAKGKHSMSWNELANQLNERCGGSKSGKQCRERYRNYANPKLEISEWRPNEKLLLVILHRFYGNHWSIIGKRLSSRSDISIKNYYYCLTRKATKFLKSEFVPLSILKKPKKFYMVFSLLDSILENYMNNLHDKSHLNNTNCKESIISGLLKKRETTEDGIRKYQTLMIRRFKDYHKPANFPIIIDVALSEFNF